MSRFVDRQPHKRGPKKSSIPESDLMPHNARHPAEQNLYLDSTGDLKLVDIREALFFNTIVFKKLRLKAKRTHNAR